MKRHAAILFDTPHHGAGIAEWAIICSKEYFQQVKCAKTAQNQDWKPFAASFSKFAEMQKKFRKVIRKKTKVDIAGGYSTIQYAPAVSRASCSSTLKVIMNSR